MRSLNTYISESFPNKDMGSTAAISVVQDWLYHVYGFRNPKLYSIDLDTCTVNSDAAVVVDKTVDRLLPYGWSWGPIKFNFDCSDCKNLKSLEGAPPKARDFICIGCKSLTSLLGGPLTVTQIFNCSGCDMLKDLTGAPRRLSGDFDCSDCKNLKSLKGAPKTAYIFDCDHCDALRDIKDAPNVKQKLILPFHLR